MSHVTVKVVSKADAVKLDGSEKNYDHNNVKFLIVILMGPTEIIAAHFCSSSMVK